MSNVEKSSSAGENEEKINYSTLKEPPPPIPVPMPDDKGRIPPYNFPRFIPKRVALIMLVLLSCMFLIGLIQTVYTLGRNSVLKELNPEAPVVPPKDPVIFQGTPTPDPTADWKTYTGDGFSFNYPQDYQIKEQELYNQITGNTINALHLEENLGIFYLNIYVEKNVNNLSADDFLENYKNDVTKSDKPNFKPGKVVAERVNETKSEYKNGMIVGLRSILGFDIDLPTIISTYNDKIYVFQYVNNQGNEINKKQDVLVDQILSTFKFSDSNSTFCGGIMGKSCPTGYTCKLDGNYPDAGGTCIKN